MRIWSVTGHDKGEVDHVGGIAKIFIRREVVAGQVFTDAEEMCHHMSIQFEGNKTPSYHCKYVSNEELTIARFKHGRK